MDRGVYEDSVGAKECSLSQGPGKLATLGQGQGIGKPCNENGAK